jgi:class 3 adenylate cyclase
MTTTVFCELDGRAELSAVLAPEPLRTLVLRCHDIMRASIESHGGTVGPAVGDALTAVFSGAPADGARRAAAAALHMLDALAATGPLTARIGAESGETVGGTGQSVAARLVRLAEPGTVLMGPAARGLLHPPPLRRDPYPEPYARPYAAAYAEPAAL